MQIVTTNPAFGFFGTSILNYQLDETTAAEAFQAVGAEIVRLKVLPLENVVTFLDSRAGRHFCDALSYSIPRADLSKPSVAQLVASATVELTKNHQSWVRFFRRECQ